MKTTSPIERYKEKFLEKDSDCTWKNYPNPEEVKDFLESELVLAKAEGERVGREKAVETGKGLTK